MDISWTCSTPLRHLSRVFTEHSQSRSLAPARPSRIAPAQHSARGRAKLHMSLLPVIDPGAIKQHRIAVNRENKPSPRLGCARRIAYGV